MEIPMKQHNPVIGRNISNELAQIQRERGVAMTKADFKALGYKDAQLSEATIQRAAEIYARESERQAA